MHADRLVVLAAFVLAVALGSGLAASSPAAAQTCTKTMFGNCITGGNRCAKAMHGRQGWDAAGKSWFCKGSRSHPYWERSRCAKLLDRVFQLEPTSNPEINPLLDYLGDSCPAHYEVFKDYAINKGMADQLGRRSCAELLGDGTNRYAVAYLRRDGFCTGSGATSGGGTQRTNGISWSEAGSHIGTHQRVCGPLASTGNPDDDVFLNLGRKYPDPERFQIVLWDVGGVEPIRLGSMVCATGRITQYRGVPQIELRSVRGVEVSD